MRPSHSDLNLKSKTPQFPWIAETITMYEQRTSPEALFVWATDKYITLLTRHKDQGRFFKSTKLTQAKFDARIAQNHKKAHAHAAVGAYYDELRAEVAAHPEYFFKRDGHG